MPSGLFDVDTDNLSGEVAFVANFMFRDVQALLSTASPMHWQTASKKRMKN